MHFFHFVLRGCKVKIATAWGVNIWHSYIFIWWCFIPHTKTGILFVHWLAWMIMIMKHYEYASYMVNALMVLWINISYIFVFSTACIGFSWMKRCVFIINQKLTSAFALRQTPQAYDVGSTLIVCFSEDSMLFQYHMLLGIKNVAFPWHYTHVLKCYKLLKHSPPLR